MWTQFLELNKAKQLKPKTWINQALEDWFQTIEDEEQTQNSKEPNLWKQNRKPTVYMKHLFT